MPIYITLAHLSCNHAGNDKMTLYLSLYYHPYLQQKSKLFAKSYIACCITNHYNKSETLGFFPLDQNPGEVLHCDLIGFIHILIIKCPLFKLHAHMHQIFIRFKKKFFSTKIQI